MELQRPALSPTAERSLHALALPNWLRPAPTTVAAVGVLAAVFLLINHAPLWHTDVWGHLKFGQWFREQGRLPETEPFLFAAAGPRQPNHPNAWLSQSLLYEVYRLGERGDSPNDLEPASAGGVEALRALHAVAVVLRCLLIFLALRLVSGSGLVAVVGLVVMLGLSYANIAVLRPQVFGEVCCAAMLWLLSLPRLSWRMQVLGVALFVLWGNLHGSYLVGLLLWLGYLGGQMLLIFRQAGFHWRAYYEHPRFRELFRVFWVTCLVLSFASPCGYRITAYVLEVSNHPNIRDMDEWKHLEWASPWGVAFFASLLVILATLLLGFVLPPQPPPADPTRLQPKGVIPLGQLIMLALVGAQTYLHQRMMPWWVMLVPWICAPAWGRFMRMVAPAAGTIIPAPERLAVALRPILITGVLVWIAVAWSGLGQWLLHGTPRPLEQALHPGTPLALARQLLQPVSANSVPALKAWLAQQRLTPADLGPIFASETQGEFLLWSLPEACRPVVYTHVHLFTPEHWQAVMRVKNGRPGWEAILSRWGCRLLVVEADLHADLCRQLRAGQGGWRVLVDDAASGSRGQGDPKARLLIAVH